MDNKRLTSNLILIFIMILMIGCCSAQPIVIIPKAVTPTTAHQVMIWDGSTFKLKELVGFTSSSTQMTIPVAETSIMNHGSINVNNTSLTTVTNAGVAEDNGSNSAFTIYLHYTTDATTEGMRFRLEPTGTGTFWYDYDFPITGSRVRGIIYNANTTIVIPSSETGTNVGIIRGISKSGGGAFSIALQVSAEDGSSSITTLTTGVTQY